MDTETGRMAAGIIESVDHDYAGVGDPAGRHACTTTTADHGGEFTDLHIIFSPPTNRDFLVSDGSVSVLQHGLHTFDRLTGWTVFQFQQRPSRDCAAVSSYPCVWHIRIYLPKSCDVCTLENGVQHSGDDDTRCGVEFSEFA